MIIIEQALNQIKSNLLCILGLIFVFIILYYEFIFYVRSRPGIKGPIPLPIFGNMLSMLKTKRSELEIEWRKKYGKVYMTYLGGLPRLTIADPEIIIEIGVRNSSKFQDLANVSPFSKYQSNSVFNLRGHRWRKVRTLITPAFTSGKIKKMFKLLDTISNDLIDIITNHIQYLEHSNSLKQPVVQKQAIVLETNPDNTFMFYTVDGISTCGYGIKLNLKDEYKRKNGIPLNETFSNKEVEPQKEKPKTMFKVLEEILASSSIFIQLLPIFVPRYILMRFSVFKNQTKRFDEMAKRIDAVIKSRIGREHEYADLLSSIYASKLNDNLDILDTDINEAHHGGEISENSAAIEYAENCKKILQDTKDQSVGLSQDEFYANCVTLLAVGATTTSFSMATVAYFLAFHQECQDKLYEEVKSVAIVDANTKRIGFDYETLTSLPYLDAFLSEVLRMCGPIIFSTRICNQDHYIEKYGITVKKDEIVQFAYHSIHHDEDYWENAEKFDPERFMPANKDKIKTGTYLPFGIGPRKCIGMRFSLTESKLALAKLVYHFKFVPAKGSSFPPEEGRSGFARKFVNLKLGLQLR